jgi:hypothetical protein
LLSCLHSLSVLCYNPETFFFDMRGRGNGTGCGGALQKNGGRVVRRPRWSSLCGHDRRTPHRGLIQLVL